MRLAKAQTDRVETALKAQGLPPLAWYDVLLEVERAGDAGLRPFHLTERLLLPQYGTSRLVERLRAEGLIERVPCADDGRGFVIRLTPEGRAMRARMWPVYADTIDALAQPLDAKDRAKLADLLDRLAGRS